MRHFLTIGIALLNIFFISHNAFADEVTVPPAFTADISKPTEEIQVNLPPNPAKVSPRSTVEWQQYINPIQHCIPGDIIVPSKGNGLLSYIFENEADTNATLSIAGWKKNKCPIEFKEATLGKTCLFNGAQLKTFTDNLLNAELFDKNGSFAQTLSSLCQS